MAIEIKIKEEPPRELIRVIEEYYGQIKAVKEILIDVDIKTLSKGGMAAFNPKTGQVVLDLNKCLASNRWIDQGLMRIQSVWFNMLRALYHEGTHAEQLAKDPKLIKRKALPTKYEEEAEAEATFQICAWAEKGGTVPKLDEMGWCGDQLKDMINRFYTDKEMRPLLMQELDALESNAVIEVETFVAQNENEFSEESYKHLCESIDNKEFGIKLGGVRYLDPLGFFGFMLEKEDVKDREANRAKTAQDRANKDKPIK